jgi:hypothetical protein
MSLTSIKLILQFGFYNEDTCSHDDDDDDDDDDGDIDAIWKKT